MEEGFSEVESSDSSWKSMGISTWGEIVREISRGGNPISNLRGREEEGGHMGRLREGSGRRGRVLALHRLEICMGRRKGAWLVSLGGGRKSYNTSSKPICLSLCSVRFWKAMGSRGGGGNISICWMYVGVCLIRCSLSERGEVGGDLPLLSLISCNSHHLWKRREECLNGGEQTNLWSLRWEEPVNSYISGVCSLQVSGGGVSLTHSSFSFSVEEIPHSLLEAYAFRQMHSDLEGRGEAWSLPLLLSEERRRQGGSCHGRCKGGEFSLVGGSLSIRQGGYLCIHLILDGVRPDIIQTGVISMITDVSGTILGSIPPFRLDWFILLNIHAS